MVPGNELGSKERKGRWRRKIRVSQMCCFTVQFFQKLRVVKLLQVEELALQSMISAREENVTVSSAAIMEDNSNVSNLKHPPSPCSLLWGKHVLLQRRCKFSSVSKSFEGEKPLFPHSKKQTLLQSDLALTLVGTPGQGAAHILIQI